MGYQMKLIKSTVDRAGGEVTYIVHKLKVRSGGEGGSGG